MAAYGLVSLETGQTLTFLVVDSAGAIWNGSAYVAPSTLANTAAWRALLGSQAELALADATKAGDYRTTDITTALAAAFAQNSGCGSAIVKTYVGATPSPTDLPVSVQGFVAFEKKRMQVV